MNSYNLYKHKQIEERAVEVANYIIENNATVRETAKKFGISKSTVHKDVTERLGRIDPLLARQKDIYAAGWPHGKNICILHNIVTAETFSRRWIRVFAVNWEGMGNFGEGRHPYQHKTARITV